MVELSILLERLGTLHDHVCPRQVLGARMGMAVADLFGLVLPQKSKQLYTFVEADGCFADGVMIATGCSLGHRTMHLMDFGKVAAVFVDTKTGRAFRVSPHPLSRTRAVAMFPDAKSRWHAQLAAYQVMPVEELFQIQEVMLTISLAALISQPGVRVACSRCGEEILNQREVTVGDQVLCQSCAGHGYWSTDEKIIEPEEHKHATTLV